MRSTILDGPERRRRWGEDEKTTIRAELTKPGIRGTEVARRHGVSSGLLYNGTGSDTLAHLAQGHPINRIAELLT